MAGKTCWDCVHSRGERYEATGGFADAPQPAEVGCTLPDGIFLQEEVAADDNLGYQHGHAALICPHFDPEPIGVCGGCRQEVAGERWSHTLYAATEAGPFAVCSEACKLVVVEQDRVGRDAEQREMALLDLHLFRDVL